MTASPTLVVLAAGLGSRYGGLKQLETVGPHGETLIDYALYDAVRAGFSRAVFVIRPALERDFCDGLGARWSSELSITYAHQTIRDVPSGAAIARTRDKPWGTGHAVLAARERVDGPFAVINADDFYGASSFRALRQYLETHPRFSPNFALVGFRLKDTLSAAGGVSRAICMIRNGEHLEAIVEATNVKRVGNVIVGEREPDGETHLGGEELVSMNMWGFTPAVFDLLSAEFDGFLRQSGNAIDGEFLLPTAVNHIIAAGSASVTVLPSDERWFGVTYSDDRHTARQQILHLIGRGSYPETILPD